MTQTLRISEVKKKNPEGNQLEFRIVDGVLFKKSTNSWDLLFASLETCPAGSWVEVPVPPGKTEEKIRARIITVSSHRKVSVRTHVESGNVYVQLKKPAA